jgi:hypothetical protein
MIRNRYRRHWESPVPLLFALTMFVSATLLFLVQPMVGKLILPHLGGTPAVWNTCMFFYQTLLLAGYYYSHKVSTNVEPVKQSRLHSVVLILPLAAMLLGVLLSENHSPIPVAESFSPRGDAFPFFGVMAMLCFAIALPFFVISTTAPLLQKWFAYTGHPSAKDPYFLYAASNVGSFIALFAYPFLVEPNLRIIDQAWVWAIGYALLVVMIAYCGYVVRKPRLLPDSLPVTKKPPATPAQVADERGPLDDDRPPTFWRKMWWLGLAFVPSSLMLGVTTFMSTDIASLPLLWIIPLALYLVTFIIVFSQMPLWADTALTMALPTIVMIVVGEVDIPTAQWEVMKRFIQVACVGIDLYVLYLHTQGVEEKFRLTCLLVTPVFILLIIFLKTSTQTNVKQSVILLLHMTTFFFVTMACHGELARLRPKPKYLTDFYLIMSVGGMMGGVFNGLLAPIIFTFTSEYPLTLVAACLLMPKLNFGPQTEDRFSIWDLLLPVGVYFLVEFLWRFGTPLSVHLHSTLREALVAVTIFEIVFGICVLLVKDFYFKVSTQILLGGSLVLYGTVGPLIHWLQESEFMPGLVNSFLIQPLNAEYVRWIFAAAPLGAYVVYWLRYRTDEPKKVQYAALGVVALAFAYVVTLTFLEAGIAMVSRFARLSILTEATVQQILIFGIPPMVCYFFVERPLRFGLSVGAVMLANHYLHMRGNESVLAYDRSFFGTLKVEEDETRYNITPWVGDDRIVPAESFDNYEYEEGKFRRKNVFYLRGTTRLEDGTETPRYLESHPLVRLSHGTTLHGIQRRDGMLRSIAANLSSVNSPTALNAISTLAGLSGTNHWEFPGREPLTYYHRTGPVGKMFEAFRSQPRKNNDVACIGLGTGSLSSYGIPGQTMTFFEIDNHVVKLVYDARAKDQRDKDRLAYEDALARGDFAEAQRLFRKQPNFFTYVNDAIDQGVKIEFEMGDARISLKRLPPERKYGMMLIDAFSSDSIPVHLLTKQSVELFFDRLEDDGILAMHISNRYLDLEPVVDMIAKNLKLAARVMHDRQEEGQVGKTASTWIALARNEATLKPIILASHELEPGMNLLAGPGITGTWPMYWSKLAAKERVGLWTDDYSPILKILNESFSLFGGGD